jgi:hypothetical protein
LRSKRAVVLFLLIALLGGGWASTAAPAAALSEEPPAPGAPANDDRAAARSLTLGDRVVQPTAGATVAPGEALPCAGSGASVWFRLTVPS